ncbi:EamA-like transporter family protein [Botrimarina colliarenosi]|uniref:EamA-like transporter family protein n=1 Tax=Botrimarina colliarenosi TaxID=2528001 RepID=A0A5C6ALI8_9BACT|nr:DMT family transporter [Botrimarina colliarenosi]TWT99891.1 EamA-like transporter family protein [Botrimarina colliarenosi]
MPYLALLAGCLACSTSVLWIKLSHVDPVLLTGLRLAIAATALAPWAVRDWRRHRAELNWTHLRDSALPGLVLAVHFFSWIYGARLTLATNGSLIVNLTPIATPFLLAALSSERVTRREVIATLLAATGLLILFVTDFRLSAETFYGDVVCLGSMVLFALYLVLGRKFRHHPTTMLYVTPLYAIAAAASFGVAALVGSPWPTDWRAEAPWVLLLALLPTIIGHSLLNRAMRQMRGQVVAVVNMSQFVFAGMFAWMALGERPHAAFYPAAFLVVAAGVVAAGAGWRWRRSARAVSDAT